MDDWNRKLSVLRVQAFIYIFFDDWKYEKICVTKIKYEKKERKKNSKKLFEQQERSTHIAHILK